MRILHPEFRHENTSSRYPFTDASTLRAASGLDLPENMFLDALLYPPHQTAPLYMSEISLDGDTLTIVVANNLRQPVCSGVIQMTDTLDGTIVLTDDYARPAGILLADPNVLNSLQQLAVGKLTFTANTASFVPTVIAPSPEHGVRGLTTTDADPLTNDVWIVGENGVNVTKTTVGNIRIDLVGEPLFRRQICATSDAFNDVTFLKSINDLPPTSWGGFTLQLGRVQSNRPALRFFVEDGVLMVGLALP